MTRKNAFPFIFMLALSLTPILTIEAPRMLAFWPQLIGLIGAAWFVFAEKKTLSFSKPYLYGVLSICGLCLTSVLWSISPSEALIHSLKISAILISGSILFALCLSIENERLRPYYKMFPSAVIIACTMCYIELNWDMPLYRIIRGLEPGDNANPSELNRGIVCITFTFFIALAFIKNMNETQTIKKLYTLALILCVILMLFITDSQSAQLAFIMGLLIFAFFPYRYAPSYRILALLITAIIAATPFIIFYLYAALISTGQDIPWLSQGYAGNRVEIWNFVIDYALNNPIYGYGIEATRYVKDFQHVYIYHTKPTTLHPHNFSVQIWIEFGIIGVLFFGALLFSLAKKIEIQPNQSQKYILSSSIAILSVAAMGYGVWQSWWLGEIVYIGSLCALISSQYRQSEKNIPT